MVTFDPAKDAANREKHGISLARVADMRDIVIIPVSRPGLNEDRTMLVGRIDGRVFVGVVTYRAGGVRAISLRPASRKEREAYAEKEAE